MNNLCAEIGWKSINHEGEQLCGDHVDIIEQDENSTVIVLADGSASHTFLQSSALHRSVVAPPHNGIL